ncbi:GNAT family N-acetyltransferase [Paenibacillus sp. 22594]
MTINADKNNKYISAVKELYHSSFPKIEQIPFRNILKLCEKDKAALLIFTDNNEFVGFTLLIHYQDIIFILYFAINNQIRGKGYGGRALQIIRETYINKRIILNIETTKQNGQNQEQRMKRKLFYLNNGYTEAGLSVEDKGETYDMLISGGTIEKEEYRKLLIFTMGKFLFWFMEPKVVLNP